MNRHIQSLWSAELMKITTFMLEIISQQLIVQDHHVSIKLIFIYLSIYLSAPKTSSNQARVNNRCADHNLKLVQNRQSLPKLCKLGCDGKDLLPKLVTSLHYQKTAQLLIDDQTRYYRKQEFDELQLHDTPHYYCHLLDINFGFLFTGYTQLASCLYLYCLLSFLSPSVWIRLVYNALTA